MIFKKKCPSCQTTIICQVSYWKSFYKRVFKCLDCGSESEIRFGFMSFILYGLFLVALTILITHPSLIGLYSNLGFYITVVIMLLLLGPSIMFFGFLRKIERIIEARH